MKPRTLLSLAVPVVSALSLTACGPGQPDGTSAAAAGEGSKLTVMASFYPLQYVTEQVGGDLVTVESLTPPGAEPHDLELSPAAVASLESAGAVVYLSGFQPAVDDAIEQASPEHVLDVSAQADLESGHSEAEHAAEGETEGAHAGDAEGHAEESGHAGEEKEHGGKDPHFWLDPLRLATAANAVADELGEADPDNAAAYKANAEALAGKLTALDSDLTEGLGTCENRTIVVSHEAYGYLANKYELEQVGIAGLEPDTEPSPARLAEIGEVVRNEGVTTIFTESLVNPKVAETLAEDLKIGTAVLDPLEGQADGDADYEQVMRQNLQALRGALSCA